MVGGLQLSSCCANPVPDADVPACPFTTMFCEFEERSTFFASNIVHSYLTFQSNHPGCALAQSARTVEWNSYDVPGFGVISSADIEGVATSSASWAFSSQVILNQSNGPIVRLGTNVVIATCNYRVRELTFNRTSRIRTATQGVVQSGDETKYAVDAGSQFYCCDSASTPQDFPIYTQGASATTTTPTAVASHTIRWVGACNQRVVGLSLARTGVSPATDPWTIEVAGGKLRLIDVNGNVTEYSGLLNTVRQSINTAGLFTATNGPIVTANANTTDLLPMRSDPILSGCTKQVLVADVGFPVAPGVPTSTGYGGQGFISNSNGTQYFDAAATGLSNDIAGLQAFMAATRYPKLTPGGATGIGSFEFFDLGLSSGWSLTSGTSFRNETITATAPSVSSRIVTITCGPDCLPVTGVSTCGICENQGMIGYSAIPGFPSFGPATGLNTLGFTDCNGNTIQEVCTPTDFGIYGCYTDETTVTPKPDRNFNHSRTLQGTMYLA